MSCHWFEEAVPVAVGKLLVKQSRMGYGCWIVYSWRRLWSPRLDGQRRTLEMTRIGDIPDIGRAGSSYGFPLRGFRLGLNSRLDG